MNGFYSSLFPYILPGARILPGGGSGGESAFVSTWNTENSGVTANDTISLPLETTGTYDFVVDWGDGSQDTIQAWDDAAKEHQYDTPGIYEVSITGTIEGLRFNNGGDKLKIVEISNWGPLELKTISSFLGCTNLECTATDDLIVQGNSMTNMFYLTSVSQVGSIDVSNIVFFDSTFRSCPDFNQDIDDWDVSSATTFSRMFLVATSFNQSLNSWDMSSAQTIFQMFSSATSFNQPLGNWRLPVCTSFRGAFQGATAFNQDLDDWDVSSGIDFQSMFQDATAFQGGVSNWDMSSATNITNMFLSAVDFNSDVTGWNTSNIQFMSGAFRNTSFDQDISGWDVTSATNMNDMFRQTQMSTANYDALLVGWESQAVNDNINFHAGTATYSSGSAAETARTALINDHSWTFTDGGAV